MGCCQGSKTQAAYAPSASKAAVPVLGAPVTAKGSSHASTPILEQVVYAAEFEEWRAENPDLEAVEAGRKQRQNPRPPPSSSGEGESPDAPPATRYDSPWVTVQCARGKPLVLKGGEWVVTKEQVSFHEWLIYALWIQRDNIPADANIELRSQAEEGRLVPYQVQVGSDSCVALWEAVRGPWEEMKQAYRQPQNHGGTVAPSLKWGVPVRFLGADQGNGRGRSPHAVSGANGSLGGSEPRSDAEGSARSAPSLRCSFQRSETDASTGAPSSMDEAFTTDEEGYELGPNSPFSGPTPGRISASI